MTIKSLAIQVALVLFSLVAMLACEQAAAKEHTHTSAEIAEADHVALHKRTDAAHCYIYEYESTARASHLEVFRRRIGEYSPAVVYAVGYANGQVVGTAFTLVASSYKKALYKAAQILYKRYKCKPVEDT